MCGATPPPGRYRFPPYAVTRCPECRTWFLSPRLDEASMLASYGGHDYFEGEGPGYSSYLAQEATLRSTFRRFLSELERRRATGGKLLEVGCAYGFFLDEARPYFAHRVGTDFSSAALGRAQGRAESLLHGGLERVPAGADFDTAIAIHTIEHVYSPVELVRGLLDRLRPGGAVVLATPDMAGFWRHLMGRRWTFFKIPEHVVYFDRQSLRRLLKRAGCVAVEPVPYAGLFSLRLIAEKLGVVLPRWLGGLELRLPATTVAMLGRKPVA